MTDYQLFAAVLREMLIFYVLIISRLVEISNFLKMKPTDNERVSQCSGCSG
jgi:hypothetical protein